MSNEGKDLWIAPDGAIRYIEIPDLDLSALGEKQSRRLSRIEWDGDGQRWKVFESATGNLLGNFESRKQAVDFEYNHFRNILNQKHSQS